MANTRTILSDTAYDGLGLELTPAQVGELQAHITNLEDALLEVRDLLRTGCAPDAFNMTPEQWAQHKINRAASIAARALEVSNG